MLDKEQLIQSIHTAFKDTIQPNHVGLLIGDWGIYIDHENAEKDFTNTDWQEIPFTAIYKHGSDTISGLTTEWFCYLLPAFMVRLLENMAEADTLLGTIQINLTHPFLWEQFAQNYEDDFNAKVSLFDSHQCEVISHYFRYYVSCYPDDVIYDYFNIRSVIQYWDQKKREKQENGK